MIEVEIEKLEARHDRASFFCGLEAVDDFIKDEPLEAAAIGKLATWVAIDPESHYRNSILGYYAIGITALRQGDTNIRGKDHEWFGFVYLAYLGTRFEYQRQGIGDQLLFHALSHVPEIARRVGVIGVYLRAAGDTPYHWYKNRGFVSLPCGRSHLFMPTRQIVENLNLDG